MLSIIRNRYRDWIAAPVTRTPGQQIAALIGMLWLSPCVMQTVVTRPRSSDSHPLLDMSKWALCLLFVLDGVCLYYVGLHPIVACAISYLFCVTTLSTSIKPAVKCIFHKKMLSLVFRSILTCIISQLVSALLTVTCNRLASWTPHLFPTHSQVEPHRQATCLLICNTFYLILAEQIDPLLLGKQRDTGPIWVVILLFLGLPGIIIDGILVSLSTYPLTVICLHLSSIFSMAIIFTIESQLTRWIWHNLLPSNPSQG